MQKATTRDKVFNLLFKRLLHFFPIITFSIWIYFAYAFYQEERTILLVAFILTPYLFPLICYRLLVAIYPIKEGASYIGVNEEVFSPWLFSLRLQQIYIVFPQLERLLFFLPGMYKLWLTLWGANIGKNVFFVPNITIHDRGLLEIGDNVVFGDRSYISSHFLQVKNGRFLAYVRKVRIGSNVFIGAFSHMGPGTKIASNTMVPASSFFTVNKSQPQTLIKD